MTEEDYYNLHKECPNCKNSKGLPTTMRYYDVANGEKDYNKAHCITCDWIGVVDDLIEMPARK